MNEPDDIIYEIFALFGFYESSNSEILKYFLQVLKRFSIKKSQNSSRSQKHQYCQSTLSKYKAKKRRKNMELLLNKTRTIYRMLSKFNCSKSELDKLINDGKTKARLKAMEKA